MIENKLYLVKPSAEHETLVMDYRQDFFLAGEKKICGSCGLHYYETFSKWLEAVEKNWMLENTENTTKAYTYLAFQKEDNELIGNIQLRETIANHLSIIGGHIGYSVRPSERRKGYAKEMLQQVLTLADSIGIEKVRIDCDKNNIASQQTVLSCGGSFLGEALATVRKSGTSVEWISPSYSGDFYGQELLSPQERLLCRQTAAFLQESPSLGASKEETIIHQEYVRHYVINTKNSFL